MTGTLRRDGYRLAAALDGSLQERELLVEYASAYRDALDILELEYSRKRVLSIHAPQPPGLAEFKSKKWELLLSVVVKIVYVNLQCAVHRYCSIVISMR